MSILSPAGGLENETLTVVCEKKIKVRYLALVSVSMTAAMKFQISQSFELFFRFLKIFFEKVTDAWVSELGSLSGSKSDPSAGPFLVTFRGFLYTFLKACLNSGTFLGPFFGPTGEPDFGFGCVQKKQDFLKKCAFFFRKNGWLGAPWGPKIRFTSGANLSHVLHVSFESCRRVLYRVPGRGRFWSRLQGPEPEQVTVTNSTWQKNR